MTVAEYDFASFFARLPLGAIMSFLGRVVEFIEVVFFGQDMSDEHHRNMAEYERQAAKNELGEHYFETQRPDGSILYGDKRLEGKDPNYRHGHFGDGQNSRDGREFHRGPRHKLGALVFGDRRTDYERTRRWGGNKSK